MLRYVTRLLFIFFKSPKITITLTTIALSTWHGEAKLHIRPIPPYFLTDHILPLINIRMALLMLLATGLKQEFLAALLFLIEERQKQRYDSMDEKGFILTFDMMEIY